MLNKHQKFYIYSNSGGCPQNQLDGGRIVRYLLDNNYVITKNFNNSDIVIVNSCSYSSFKEKQSFEKVHRYYHSGKKNKLVILTGCLPRIAPHLLKDLPGDIRVIPGCEPERIEEIIKPVNKTFAPAPINFIPARLFHYSKIFRRFLFRFLSFPRYILPIKAAHVSDRLFMFDHTPKSFIVEICKGCLGNCAYCAIRFSRGQLKSRPVQDILSEIKAGVDRNVKEILLTATDTAAYGKDIGTDLATLVTQILDITGDRRLLIFYANPRWLIEDLESLKPVFATGRIHFIHLSLNGASDNVLRNMNRGYTLEEFEDLIRTIKKLSPGTVLQTQVITGFPGETEDDFKATIDFFRNNYFHNVQVFAFDPRPRTAAYGMPGQIPELVKQKRRRKLYGLTLRRKVIFNLKYILSGFQPSVFQ